MLDTSAPARTKQAETDAVLAVIAAPAIVGLFLEALLGASPPGTDAATYSPFGACAVVGYVISCLVAAYLGALWLRADFNRRHPPHLSAHRRRVANESAPHLRQTGTGQADWIGVDL